MILDSSVLLAIYFEEIHGRWAVDRMQRAVGVLTMSTVNLAEVLILLQDRQPARFVEIEARLLASGIRFVAPDVTQVRIAAKARMRFPLNLGDCFAYALARVEGAPLLTTDRDFRGLDIPVIMP